MVSRGARGDRPARRGDRGRTSDAALHRWGGGRRRILPPLVFGLGVLFHLLRHPRRYEVLHTCAFPYFSLLAAALGVRWRATCSRRTGSRCGAGIYWLDYLGGPGGPGRGVRAAPLRAAPAAGLLLLGAARPAPARRGASGDVTVLRGLYDGARTARRGAAGTCRERPRGPLESCSPGGSSPRSRPPSASLRSPSPASGSEPGGALPGRRPRARSAAGGDRGERSRGGSCAPPASLTARPSIERCARALCLLLPSRREGYGLVVVEAGARGTPSVVVAGEDNAATELVEEGVNGAVAPDGDTRAVAEAIERVEAAGEGLRERTAEWFAANVERLYSSPRCGRSLRDTATPDINRPSRRSFSVRWMPT